MKAKKARKASIKPQYNSAMKEINQAIGWGWKYTCVGYGTLYPEVAKMLAKDGYDIKIVKRKEDSRSYNEVSWEFSQKGKKGNITYVNETETESKNSVHNANSFASVALRDIDRKRKLSSKKM